MFNTEPVFVVALLAQVILGAVFLFRTLSGGTTKAFRSVVLLSSAIGGVIMSSGLPNPVNLLCGAGIGACWGGAFFGFLNVTRNVFVRFGPEWERYADYLILGVLTGVPSLVYLGFEREWLGAVVAVSFGILLPVCCAWFVRGNGGSTLPPTLAKFFRAAQSQSIATWTLGGMLVGVGEAAVAASFTPSGLGQGMMLIVGGFWMALWGGLIGAAIAAIRY